MKVERYILEYASAKRKALENNSLMNTGVKKELLRRIDYAVKMRERGYIIADEAIQLIGNLVPKEEDFTEYMT